MLISQAFISMLASWDRGQLPNIPERFFKNRMLVTLFGIFVATLKAQNPDGSWGFKPSLETSAYALIVLATTASLPLASYLGSQLCVATNAGRIFLLKHRDFWSKPDYIWRGKTTYGSGVLTETYVITALAIPTPSQDLGPSVDRLCKLEDQHRDIVFSNLTQLPLFSDISPWLVEAAIIEAYLYEPMLKRAGLEIFPRRDIVQTKHIIITSFFWTGPNHVRDADMSPKMLFDMMVACLLIYEIDHYTEKYIARLEPTKTNSLRALIDGFIEERDTKIGTSNDASSEILHPFKCFANWFLHHASVLGSSVFDKNVLKKELRASLFAQVTSIEESSRLANLVSHSTSAPIFDATESFYDWVHGTSAEHAGVKLLFSFLTCLVGAHQHGTQDCFPSVEAKYLAQDLNAHLGTMGRIENDYGSLARDLKERNLNCVNFPEFATTSADGSSTLDVRAAKDILTRLAAFERDCYETIMRRLKPLVNQETWKSMRTFCNAIDMGGQVYAADDPAPKIAK